MNIGRNTPVTRRDLLVRVAPACGLACLSAGSVTELAGALTGAGGQEVHKFDRVKDQAPFPLTERNMARMQNQRLFQFIGVLREDLGDPEVVRLLNVGSEELGKGIGEYQAKMALEGGKENSFDNFAAQFRPPNYSEQLTHEVVTDTEDTFELRVTECINATAFQEAGLSGDIGHAAVCNMDYAWPTAYNPGIRMERTKTLMQGDCCCNHRYLCSREEG